MYLILILILPVIRNGYSNHLQLTTKKYQLSSINHYPLPPLCQTQVASTGYQIATFHLIQADQSQLPLEGLIYWDEVLETRCTTNFWGQPHQVILASTAKPPVPISLELAKYYSNKLAIGETRDTSEENIFDCTWMQSNRKVTVRKWISKLIVQWMSDGTLYNFPGSWKSIGDLGGFSDGIKRLQLISSPHLNCPFMSVERLSGFFRNESKRLVITIPTPGYQFQLDLSRMAPLCLINNTLPVYQTDSNYLISYEALTTKRRQTRSQTIIDASPNSLQNAHILYGINHLTDLAEIELRELEHGICSLMSSEWALASSSGSPTALARYMTRDPFSVGRFEFDSIAIYSLVKGQENCTLPVPRTIQDGYLGLNCTSGMTWVEPLTGAERSNLTGMFINQSLWIPMAGDRFIHYFSGVIRGRPGVSNITLPRLHNIYVEPSRPHIGSNTSLHYSSLLIPPEVTADFTPWVQSITSFFSKISTWISIMILVIILLTITKLVSKCPKPDRNSRRLSISELV